MDLWPGESTRVGMLRVFDPDGSTCDCSTPIGSAVRRPLDPRRLERESRQGARRRWSAARRRAWVEQRIAAAQRSAGPAVADVAPSLQPWCDLAYAAALDSHVGRIGVLAREFDTKSEDWRPTETTAATVEALLHVAKNTPTWLLPQ